MILHHMERMRYLINNNNHILAIAYANIAVFASLIINYQTHQSYKESKQNPVAPYQKSSILQ